MSVGDEVAESQAVIDVVDYGRTACAQPRPGAVQLEPGVPAGVQAVVHEDLDLAEVVEYAGQPVPAGALDVVPARAQLGRDGDADLPVQCRISGRQGDAP